MSTNAVTTPVQTFEFTKEESIEAPIEIVFQSILEELGPEAQLPDGKPMAMKLETWPGGRWFRDLGDNAGHLWGHVQVIKAPTLLELSGPFFMSYPGVNHSQYRLVAEGKNTRLKFVHKAIGLIPPDHLDGMNMGWGAWMQRILDRSIKAAKQN